MANNKERDDNFSYEVAENFDFILEESGNGSINLRKISWNGRPYKLDIRKYTYKDGEERMMKGVSMSDEAGSELASILVENGYGDTKRIIKAIRARTDFDESMLDKDVEIQEDDNSEEFYDPKQLLYSGSGDDDEY